MASSPATVFFEHEVPVPGLVDLANPPYDWQQADYHWYGVKFSLKPEQKLLPVAVLVIEQAMFGTQAWLNGKALGSDISCYTSQEYDLSEALDRKGENQLLVRVGARHTLPPESAVGKDQERQVFIPGIWGDVRLEFSGTPRLTLIQMIPDIQAGRARVKVRLQNTTDADTSITLAVRIREHSTGTIRGEVAGLGQKLAARSTGTTVAEVLIEAMHLWSPDDPFLYRCEVEVRVAGDRVDQAATTFGMREFRVDGKHFLLNGEEIFLRGGNIAFHRFLSDDQRGSLPWNPAWIKRALIEIPKQHNFNFFRNHVGQMYNRWYDIADEHGMLLQNEWQFWTTSGTKEQIVKEFTRWVEDNANHPSIIIWDPLNESSDVVVQTEIVPMMKDLDPTRPWESVDFVEEHPYIYSLGPVLNEKQFGFTRPLQEIEASTRPTMLNEFNWWWLDREGQPTSLMSGVVERWLGPSPTQQELLERQSYLVVELVELFRRMGVNAIQPFVYLSNNDGPTAHWFEGNIADLRPKPILAALKDAFAPVGVSIELWDRHFLPGERRTIRLFLMNDMPKDVSCQVRYWVSDATGAMVNVSSVPMHVRASERHILPLSFQFPRTPGPCTVQAELHLEGSEQATARSRKPGFVVTPPARETINAVLAKKREGEERIAVQEGDVELQAFLGSMGVRTIPLGVHAAEQSRVALISRARLLARPGSPADAVEEPGAAAASGQAREAAKEGAKGGMISMARGVMEKLLQVERIAKAAGALARSAEEVFSGSSVSAVGARSLERILAAGGTVILLEPELGVEADESLELVKGVEIRIHRREDIDKGGYDSYVFPDDPLHPVWEGIPAEHLRMFNGGFGGEMVSQHDVVPSVPFKPLAHCGLQLQSPALMEVPVGSGRIVISRIQVRGRLTEGGGDAALRHSRGAAGGLGAGSRESNTGGRSSGESDGWRGAGRGSDSDESSSGTGRWSGMPDAPREIAVSRAQWQSGLYDRRPDPVAQRYLLNLLAAFWPES